MHGTGQRRAARRRRSRAQFARTLVPGAGVLVLLGAATAAVVHVPASPSVADAAVASSSSVLAASEAQPPTVSRNAERPPLPNETVAEEAVEGVMWAVADAPILADHEKGSPELASVATGDQVEVTGETSGDWTEVMHKGAPRWIASSALSTTEPLGTAPCPTGSGVESGLLPDTIKVHRAICAKFPQITSYGGVAGRGEHATGHALDIMVSSDLGNEIAAYLQEHRSELGIEYLIWRQRIWRPSTSGAWRGMSDRGGATANHYDHVHVTTYGSAATS